MSTTLENFEKKFTATNLKNGLSYWKKDLFEVIEDSPSVLEANVYGENEYTTSLKFAGDAVVDANCSCPNYRTIFCKHIAILFYEKFKAVFNFKKTAPRKSKKKALQANIQGSETIINNLSIDQLKDIVVFSMQLNKEIKNYVETIAAHKKPLKSELYKLYYNSLKTLIKNNKKQYHISEAATNKIGQQALKYLEQAELYFENKDDESGIYICRAVLEALLTNVYDASLGTDSDYSIAIDRAIDEVSLVINKETTPEKLKKSTFTFLFNVLQKEEVLYSNYEVPILKLTTNASSSVLEKDKLVTFLEENLNNTSNFQDYFLVFNTLIEKHDGKIAAKNHLMNNLAIPVFREKIYINLIENKDYKEAKKIIEEGIKVNENDYNAVINWYKKLLFIAEQTNDNEGVINISATLFFNIKTLEDSFKYYHIHKAQFSKSEWKAQSKLLISEIEDKKKLQEIYLIEGLTDELLKSLSKTDNYYWRMDLLPFSDKHLDTLLPNYEDQVLKIFKVNLKTYLDNNQGKLYYKEVCENIIKLKKRGIDTSNSIAFIKENYNRRPSLMNFLNTYFL